MVVNASRAAFASRGDSCARVSASISVVGEELQVADPLTLRPERQVVIEMTLADVVGAREERDGLSGVRPARERGQTLERIRHVHVRLPERLLANRQGALVARPGAIAVAASSRDGPEPVERRGNGRMVRAEGALQDRLGSLEQRLGVDRVRRLGLEQELAEAIQRHANG